MRKYTVVMATIAGEGTIEAETKEGAFEKAQNGVDEFINFFPRCPLRLGVLDVIVHKVIPMKKSAANK